MIYSDADKFALLEIVKQDKFRVALEKFFQDEKSLAVEAEHLAISRSPRDMESAIRHADKAQAFSDLMTNLKHKVQSFGM